MRGVEFALGLLLLSASCNSIPQYGPGSGNEGLPPIVVSNCPAYTHDCVPYYQCIDGVINTSGVGLIDVRIKPSSECINPEYPDVPGICCRIPGATTPTPPPAQSCPGTQVCVEQGQCNADGSVNVDGAGLIDTRLYITCYVNTAVTGICCEPPTPAPVVTCPGNQVCLAEGLCIGVGAIVTDGTYNVLKCYVNTAVTGVCCEPPTPAPVVTCPGNQVCLAEGLCTDVAATGGTYNVLSCYLDQANYVTGICCDPPIPIYVCPGDSVCLPEILCRGDILDTSDNYIPYSNGGIWSLCSFNGDLQINGVCCRNPVTPPPYPVATECGVRNYGLDVRHQVKLQKNEAQFGEFPWQAVLFFSNFTFKCGASFLGDRWLITGAHCVNGYQYGDFKIRLGEWQVDRYDEPLPYVDVDIAAITSHPNFNPDNLHNDVAVLELTAPVPHQYHINSVCLPSPGQVPYTGTRCFATGWGKDAFDGDFQAILKKVEVPTVEYSSCQDLLRKTRLGKYFQLDKSFMCAGGEENVDACTGDGGGPLVCEDPTSGLYILQGITAWGINCGQKDVPGVYADVQYFSDWIDGVISGTSGNPYPVK